METPPSTAPDRPTNPASNPPSPFATLLGAVVFYTSIPLPSGWPLAFSGIARWAPIVGLAIGGGLGLLDTGLAGMGLPLLTRSALVVLVWVAVTGGLHLDGAIDTGDGLAVFDSERRLEVMADSRTGAFGVMSAIAILLLKTAALTDISTHRWLALITASSWGRWGQLLAIGCYPYLKPQGKGAFHKAAIQSGWEALPSLVLLLGLSGGWGYWANAGSVSLGLTVCGATIASATGAWFNRQLGGQTGDTYGAIVEWTEALFLCSLTGPWFG
jgi:adenosylcobinamide-GDP ribazoletransferase